jgi:hypothetical protein
VEFAENGGSQLLCRSYHLEGAVDAARRTRKTGDFDDAHWREGKRPQKIHCLETAFQRKNLATLAERIE